MISPSNPPASPLPLQKATVLIVDPSATDRAEIGECLGQLPDVRVVTAGDAEAALRGVEEHRPSLILLDSAQKGVDGLSLTRAIRTWERATGDPALASWTPIVFISSINDEDLLAQGILAGGDDFLYKPVSEVVLLAKVRAMLRIAARQREIHEAHRQLRQIASFDSLTGIPNRRYFDDMLNTEWRRCTRSGSPLSVILCDVDFFKQFNDIYGHQAGDACLKAIAGSLSESLFRVEDSVARYGGEEFVALLPGADISGASAVAERMRQSARELHIPHERGIDGRISCSFGVATVIPNTDNAAAELLRQADENLYAAKHAGRNRVMSPDLSSN